MKEQPLSDEMFPLRACCHQYYKHFRSFRLTHSGKISRREKQILFCFSREWLKGLWDKISLCSSERWERYLLIMFLSSHCALPLMECLPLAFQRQKPIKATDDSRWCAVRSFDSFRRFESDIFIPFPRIWGLFAFFMQCLMQPQELSTLFLFTPAF